jgi:hypothetical protein
MGGPLLARDERSDELARLFGLAIDFFKLKLSDLMFKLIELDPMCSFEMLDY